MTRDATETLLERELHRLESELRGIKEAQILDESNLTVNETSNAGTWDITKSMSAFLDYQWRVTFTPDSQPDAFAEIVFDHELTNSNSFERVQVYFEPVSSEDSTKQEWIVYVFNSSNAQTFRFKTKIKCLDTGTLSVVEI